MNKLMKTIIMCGLLTTISIYGCGAQVEVAKDKAIAKIDALLGTMDVKRKEIEITTKGLNEGIDGIRKAKIKAKVKHEQVEEKIAPLTEKISSIDQSLKKLRDHLKSTELVTFGGKTYQPDELKQMAEKLITARKNLSSQQEGLLKSQESLTKVVTTLERKQQDYEQKLSKLDTQVNEIDAKRVALKAMKEASALMGESEDSLIGNVEELEDKVNDLFADVETELLAEDEKWESSMTEQEIDSVDSFLSETKESSDTISEIDQILGESE